MKTPLMELIDWYENATNLGRLYNFHIKATELLKKEREVIEEAYNEGFVNCPHSTYIGRVITASDYYTKTFTNESK